MNKEDIVLPYMNERFLEMMEDVDKKTLYSVATQSEDGLFSYGDKRKLDGMEDMEALTNIEIDNLLT